MTKGKQYYAFEKASACKQQVSSSVFATLVITGVSVSWVAGL